MLSVCVLGAARGNVQSCVANGLQFFEAGVRYCRALYGVYIFQNRASDSFKYNLKILSFTLFHGSISISSDTEKNSNLNYEYLFIPNFTQLN